MKIKSKVGVLICDHLQPQLQAEFDGYEAMFRRLFDTYKADLEIKYYYVVDNQWPLDLNECDSYICGGSKSDVNDQDDWIKKLELFIRDLYKANKVFVGICFGHQMIAKALHGKVENSNKGWGIGVSNTAIFSSKDWMYPEASEVNLVVSHQDQIAELPDNTEVLMGNEFCPFSMIQVGGHFLGLQGHPEFSHAYSLALMNSRKDLIPAERLSQGQASLDQKTDESLVTNWIINFLNRSKPKLD